MIFIAAMGMFDDMKARMERFGKDVERSVGLAPKRGAGHTLGAAQEDAREYAFDPARPLGMTLTKRDDGRAGVAQAAHGGQAAGKGVRAGDVVAALDGVPVDYDAFMAAFSAAKNRGKTVRVRFGRALPRGGGGGGGGGAAKAKPISSGERDARRDAALRAAEKRDAAMHRKGPKQRKDASEPAAPRPERADGPRSAETQAASERGAGSCGLSRCVSSESGPGRAPAAAAAWILPATGRRTATNDVARRSGGGRWGNP